MQRRSSVGGWTHGLTSAYTPHADLLRTSLHLWSSSSDVFNPDPSLRLYTLRPQLHVTFISIYKSNSRFQNRWLWSGDRIVEHISLTIEQERSPSWKMISSSFFSHSNFSSSSSYTILYFLESDIVKYIWEKTHQNVNFFHSFLVLTCVNLQNLLMLKRV